MTTLQFIKERLGFELINSFGEVLDLRDKDKFFIQEIQGIDHVNIRMSNETISGKDGAFLGRQNYDGRAVTISGIFRSFDLDKNRTVDQLYNARREFLCKIPRFKNDVILVIYEKLDSGIYRKYRVTGRISDFESPTGNSESPFIPFSFDIRSRDSFIYDDNLSSIFLSETIISPGDFISDDYGGDPGDTLGDIIGILVSGINDSMNTGCVPTYPIITISGAYTGNLLIANQNTSQQMIISGTQTASQFLVIDTFNRTVLRNGVLNAISVKSGDWIFLQPGQNIFTFSGVNVVGATVKVEWRSAWLGI